MTTGGRTYASERYPDSLAPLRLLLRRLRRPLHRPRDTSNVCGADAANDATEPASYLAAALRHVEARVIQEPPIGPPVGHSKLNTLELGTLIDQLHNLETRVTTLERRLMAIEQQLEFWRREAQRPT